MDIEFTWDPNKELMNRKKHGVTFEEAVTAFHDFNGRILADPNHSDAEDRFILMGLSIQHRILVVCHCYRDDDTKIRIISARKATKNEARVYKEFMK